MLASDPFDHSDHWLSFKDHLFDFLVVEFNELLMLNELRSEYNWMSELRSEINWMSDLRSEINWMSDLRSEINWMSDLRSEINVFFFW